MMYGMAAAFAVPLVTLLAGILLGRIIFGPFK
jgi:hypothetical protein